jgi:hypothetical protein
VQLEADGVPTLLFATQPFVPLARGAATARDLPDARIVAVPHPLGGIDEGAVQGRAAQAVDAALTHLGAGGGTRR